MIRRFVSGSSVFALEQRGRWARSGWRNHRLQVLHDTFGHALGTHLDRVAHIPEQIRTTTSSAGMNARDGQELQHGSARRILLPHTELTTSRRVIIEERSARRELYDWATEDARLVDRGVKVDVGVVCLLLGPVEQRRPVARPLAHDLLARADASMYQAKAEHLDHVFPVRVRLNDGTLVELGPDEEVE